MTIFGFRIQVDKSTKSFEKIEQSENNIKTSDSYLKQLYNKLCCAFKKFQVRLIIIYDLRVIEFHVPRTGFKNILTKLSYRVVPVSVHVYIYIPGMDPDQNLKVGEGRSHNVVTAQNIIV